VIGIIVPAHNEEALIAHALRACTTRSAHPVFGVRPYKLSWSWTHARTPLPNWCGVMTLAIQAQNQVSRRLGPEKMITLPALTGWPSPTQTAWWHPIGWWPSCIWELTPSVARWLWITGALTGKMKRHFALTYSDTRKPSPCPRRNQLSARQLMQAGALTP
jgi:hypothetical protein